MSNCDVLVVDSRPDSERVEVVLYLHKIPLDETDPGADQSASALAPPASAEGAVGGCALELQGPARAVRAVRDASRLRPPGYVGSPTVAEVRAVERAVRLNNAAEKRRREAAARPTPGVPPPPAVAQRLRICLLYQSPSPRD